MFRNLVFGIALITLSHGNVFAAPAARLTVFVPDDPTLWDPAFTTSRLTWTTLAQIYETLYQFSYLEKEGNIEPLLALDVPKTSKNGLSIKIAIG